MLRVVTGLSLALIVSWPSSPAQAKGKEKGEEEAASCLPEDPTPLETATIFEQDRAFEWAKKCLKVTKPGFSTTCGVGPKVIAFCGHPLTATDVPSYEELAAVASGGTCSAAAGGVLTQNMLDLGTGFQDNLIRGLAQFVISRAKAEAMAWLLDRLQNDLCSGADGPALLPETCAIVASTKVYEGHPPAWGTLKSAFEVDLERLPDRAVLCLLNKGEASTDAKDLLVTGVQAARLIRQGEDPFAVAVGLKNRFGIDECKQKHVAACALHFLGFTTALLAPVPPDQAPTPEERVLLFKIAARLLVKQAIEGQLIPDSSTKPNADGSPAATLAEAEKILQKLALAIDALAAKARRANDALKQANKADPGRFQSVVRLATAVADLGRTALTMVPELPGLSAKQREHLKAGLDALEALALAVDAVVERDYARAFVYVVQAVRVAGFNGQIPTAIARYGGFVAEVASAKTAEDVQRALDSAAAPVGAALGKRIDGRTTVAVNAYVGLQGGRERIDGVAIESSTSWQYGLFAPVGIEVTGGHGGWSFGGFLSVIDLGALASFRDDETAKKDGTMEEVDVQTTPEIGLDQVFSPGLYAVLGFSRFAVGAGLALTPDLRRIEEDGALVEQESALRFSAFIAVDVTIFPF